MTEMRKLSYSEVMNYFNRVQEDFSYLKDEEYKKSFAKKLSEYADFLVSIDEKQQIDGLIAFYMNNGEFCYLTFVSVDKTHRRKGVFSIMLKALEDKARNENYHLLRLEVNKKNLNAQNVYKHAGFTVIEETEKSLFMKKDLRGTL